MNIKILGSGCSNCAKLEKVVREAVDDLGVVVEIEKVQDVAGIISYGVMSTPALVIDEAVKLVGKVPNRVRMVEILKQALPQ
ncbi:MAG: thioredoxin family protein [Desulfitobacteriaceae bacterium]